MKKYTATKDKHGNNVVVFKDKEMESVIVVIPTWWSNGPAIAIYVADSMNSNKKLELTPQI